MPADQDDQVLHQPAPEGPVQHSTAPDKKVHHEDNADQIPPTGPLEGQFRKPVESIDTTHTTGTFTSPPAAPQVRKQRVMTDRKLLVSLHQKLDKHHDWAHIQTHQILHDLNKVRNLSIKNAFVGHETFRGSWVSVSFQKTEQELHGLGFDKHFDESTAPPKEMKLRRTPSLVSSNYSSLADIVIVDFEEDCVTSPPASSVSRPDSSSDRSRVY